MIEQIIQFFIANPAITAGIAGGAGAIFAQTISSVIVDRGMRRRLATEQLERQREREAAEQQRLDETRRSLYAELLVGISTVSKLLANREEDLKSIEKRLYDLAEIVEIVGLLSPPVYADSVEAVSNLGDWLEALSDSSSNIDPDRYKRFRNDYFIPLRNSMRESIKGLRIPTHEDSKPQLRGRGSQRQDRTD